MGNVAIDKLETGMVLANDVHDRSGRLLLEAKVQLNDKHLRMFRSWGVLEVDIAGYGTQEEKPSSLDSIVTAQQLQAREAELKPLFRNVDLTHPAMNELYRLCLLRKSGHETS